MVVPALAGWHDQHEVAFAACAPVDSLGAHVLVETVAVLTRLPGGLAQTPMDAFSLVRDAFSGDVLALPGAAHLDFLEMLALADIAGGAVYDGLVASTARHHAAQLLTLDVRAQGAYRAVGADVVMLG